MQNAIPTIEVEELRFTESVVLYEDDYSWYDFPSTMTTQSSACRSAARRTTTTMS